MISDIQKNKIDYSILAIFSTAYLVFFFSYQNRPRYLFYATAAFASLYVIWGIIHHIKDDTLEIKIVLEYILVAALAVAAASTLLL